MKVFFLLAILMVACLGHALADGGYFNATLAAEAAAKAEETLAKQESPANAPMTPPSFSSVTSLDSCLKQLPEADRIEIRSHYSKPYQECLRRVSNIKYEAPPKTLAEATELKIPFGWKFLQVWKKNDKDKEATP